jgi:hypothetical protein
MPKSLASLRATAYKIPKGAVEIELTCGHTGWYVRPLPAVGSDAYCRECHDWRRRIGGSKVRSSGPGGSTPPGHPKGESIAGSRRSIDHHALQPAGAAPGDGSARP